MLGSSANRHDFYNPAILTVRTSRLPFGLLCLRIAAHSLSYYFSLFSHSTETAHTLISSSRLKAFYSTVTIILATSSSAMPRHVDEAYNDPDADIALVSTDNVIFRTQRIPLMGAR